MWGVSVGGHLFTGVIYKNKCDAERRAMAWAAEDSDGKRKFLQTLATAKPKAVSVVVVDESLLSDDTFDAGVSYVYEDMEPYDSELIWVYDKLGRRNPYFRSRFKVVFEEGDEDESARESEG